MRSPATHFVNDGNPFRPSQLGETHAMNNKQIDIIVRAIEIVANGQFVLYGLSPLKDGLASDFWVCAAAWGLCYILAISLSGRHKST